MEVDEEVSRERDDGEVVAAAALFRSLASSRTGSMQRGTAGLEVKEECIYLCLKSKGEGKARNGKKGKEGKVGVRPERQLKEDAPLLRIGLVSHI